MISGVFRATGTIGATQRSSENDEAAESLRAPLLVVVHAPFLAAIAHISDAGCALPQPTIDLIVDLREQLAGKGLDDGAHTIAWHLRHHHGIVVSINSIHNHLRAAGLVDPQPQKRPKSSYIRFAAEQPNERWQADCTHWWLADGTHVEILDWIDDHARHAISVTAHHRVTGPIVLKEFRKAIATHGIQPSRIHQPCAFTDACTTSASAATTTEPAAWSSSTTSTSASSTPPPANSCANSPSTTPR